MAQEKDRIFTLKNFDIVKIENNADHTADITILDKDTNEYLTFTHCYIQDVQIQDYHTAGSKEELESRQS